MSNVKRKLILDLESDDLLLDAKHIWVVCAQDYDTKEEFTIYNAHDLKQLLKNYDEIIGHNILMFDMPVLKKLWGIEYDHRILIDTLIISRLLLPDRNGGHSLDIWGKRLGCFKGEFKDFSRLSEEMVTYCQQDVRVTRKIYDALRSEANPYASHIQKAIRLEHDFAHVINLQIQSGFRLDKEKVEHLYDTLKAEEAPLFEEVQQLMPKVRDETHYKKLKEEGNIISETKDAYTYITPKTRKISTKDFKFEEPNPMSRTQLIKWFMSKGWKPKEFTEKGNPEINETILLSMNDTIANKVARLFRLQKQMSMIKDGSSGWLKHYREDTKRVHGSVITNGANTGRCTHANPNLGQVDKKDLRMREVWIAPEGRDLVGSDAAGLELRVLGHYLHRYDDGAFALECVEGDIHTYNKNAMQLAERNSAKTAIYALIYGAGNEKLGTIFATDQKIFGSDENKLKFLGGKLRNSIIENFTGYSELVATVQKAYKERGYLIGLDGRPLHPRSDYSALNLLIQSAGAIICKQWTVNTYNLLTEAGYEYGKDWEFHVNCHDEYQLSIVKGKGEIVKDISTKAMRMAQQYLGIKTRLDTDTRIGNNWKETH